LTAPERPIAQTINDCFAVDPGRISHDEALARLRTRLAPLGSLETVELSQALGRVIAETVNAPLPVPAHTNAAVDGYAFAHTDYDRAQGATLPLAGRAAAGRPLDGAPPSHVAVRIFTGAVMPAGCDTVAMQEDCRSAAGSAGEALIELPPGLKAGANVRQAGEDVAAGMQLFSPGDVLRPQDLAALASVGLGQVRVHAPVRVAIVSTGDEVKAPGQGALPPGAVWDANSSMLAGLARLAGCTVRELGIWPDRRQDVAARLKAASENFDVIITSGGASRGEEDHVSAALGDLGTRHFWQIAVKPGRPMMMGQVGNAAVVGLPGNPVAVFVCFLMYGFPLLRRLSGAAWQEPKRIPARAAFAFPKRKTGRREFWRGQTRIGTNGLEVEKYDRDGSGLISSLRHSDCLIDIPESTGDIAPGDTVSIIPYSTFGILGA
jgi:molybdopterin molybdotransferase